MTTPSKPELDSSAPEVSEKLPSDFFAPTLTTGTVDDDHPADAGPGETTEEFQDDEDRDTTDE
jgi:hypothetical protein